MRLVQRPANRHRLFVAALVALLALGGIVNGGAGRAARAQDGFDLPPLDDYTGLTARTANSSDGVNLREEPSVDAELLLSVPVGNVVDLRVDELNTVYTDDGIRWWPVSIWEVDGWIAGMYLEDTDAATDGGGDADAAADDEVAAEGETGDESTEDTEDGQLSAAGAFAAGDFVAVATDDGGKLAMRAGPGTRESRIAWLGNGDVIQVVDGPIYNETSAWYLITDGSINAYVFGGFLAVPTDDGPSVDAPSEQAARFKAGNAVAPVDGIDYVNIRARVSANSGHLGALAEGQVVEVVDGPYYDPDGQDWYLVDLGDGTEGYIWGGGLDRVSRELLGQAPPVAPVAEVEEAAPAPAPTGPTGTLVYPLADYVFTQAFGCSPYAFEPYDANLGCPYHNGIDLAAPLGTPLTSADGGTVKFAGWCDCGLGYYVEVEHGNGIATIYGHMNALYVSTGQTVAQGEVLGEVGSTGFSTGPHIHFMVKVGGVPVYPLGYLS